MSKSAITTTFGDMPAAADTVPFPGRTPERLVGVGFRCWLSGFETGDITPWETAWNIYNENLGCLRAKSLILGLSNFVRSVKATADRDIEVYPPACKGFCRDECLAISIIAASQHDVRTALCSCAAALIGSNDVGDTIDSAQAFAADLKSANQVLSASSICSAHCPLWMARGRLQ